MKPTMQVEHGGGKKMEIGDRGYKQFSQFIDDYAAVVNGIYEHPDQLPQVPEFEYIGSGIWLKIAPTPEKWVEEIHVSPYARKASTLARNRFKSSA